MRTDLFNERGFEIVDDAFDKQIIDHLALELARLNFGDTAKTRKSVGFGVRNPLNVAPAVKEFAAYDAVRKLIEPIVREKAQVVRAIFCSRRAKRRITFSRKRKTILTARRRFVNFDL